MRRFFQEYGGVILKVLIALLFISIVVGLAIYQPWAHPSFSDDTKIHYTSVNGNSAIYTGDPQDSGAKVTVTNPASDYQVYYKEGGLYSKTTMPKFINAGTYTVDFRIEAKGFDNVLGNLTITIHKKDWTYTAPAPRTLTYNGSAQELVSAGVITKAHPNEDISDGVIQYKLGQYGTWSTAVPKATDAGTYDVYYRIPEGANHNPLDQQKVSVTINKAVNNLALNTYSGSTCRNTTMSFTISNPGNGALSASSSDTSVATVSLSGNTVTVSGKASGNAVITVKAATNINYLEATKTYSATINNCTYSISYNYNGGSGTNATSYTQNAGYTLNAPSREHYSFTGWTGSNGTSPQTSVTIPAGSVGNRSYTANWKRIIVQDYTWRTDCNAYGLGAWNSKTQYRVNWESGARRTCYNTCYKDRTESYTCNQSRNDNSCGCGINYSDPVSGYCNDAQTSSTITTSCSASSGACPGGTKVSCYYQGGGKYQKITYSRKASRWFYYSSCTKTRTVQDPYNCNPYECGNYANGTTDWQDSSGAPSGKTYVSINSTRTVYQCYKYSGT